MAINNLITFRKGIATEWSSQNPTLASGEPGYDGTINVLKIGNGATAWNDLDPIALSSVVEDGSPILGGELNLDNHDIVIDCRNETGSTIAAGTPVYVSGYYSNNGKVLVAPADASDSSKMPAFGILNDSLDTDTEGTMGIMGVVSQVNTAGFDVGDVIYVASGGGYTNTKPILEDNLIQNLGRVLRVDAIQGRILLLGAGRSNDVPNLDEGKIWVGSNSNTTTSSTIHLDETNSRLGIGTVTPSYTLDVNGTFSANSINVNDQFTFPTTDGSADQYLKTDGLGNVTWSTLAGGGGGISNVVEDTTPQLGGTLDLNGNSVEGSAFQTTPSGTIIGASGWIYQSGQQVLSNGSFGEHIGDSQFSSHILRGQTTDASFTNIFNNNIYSGVLLASNRTFSVTANICGRRTNGDHAGTDYAAYELKALIHNDAYGTDFVGSVTKLIIGESDSTWDAQLAFAGAGSGQTDYLLVQCKGAASKNVNWVAKVDLLEVGGDIETSAYNEANILSLNNNIIP
jgi:hypothetical protein